MVEVVEYGGLRVHYYVPLDNTFVVMQIIISVIIFSIAAIVFVTSYKSNIVDPIEELKMVYINSNLIVIVIPLALILYINFFTKSVHKLILYVSLIFCLSVVLMIIFLGFKINLDTTYTKQKFEEIYEQTYLEEEQDNKNVYIGVTGLHYKTEKDYYISENIILYNNFKIITTTTLLLHLCFNIMLIHEINKVQKLEVKKKRTSKDDLILFDEEENIKI